MKSSPVIVLGAGPAASLLAMALGRSGIDATVIGMPRRESAVEGLSQRVVEALQQFGCEHALRLLGPRWLRVSRWGGEESSMNGEFVVERRAFDQALLRDAGDHGVRQVAGQVRRVRKDDDGRGRVVGWTEADGTEQTARAALVVECRGHTAPKGGPDRHAGRPLVAISRTFQGARAQARTTLTESFPMGWAWGGVDPTGTACIQVVVLPELVTRCRGDLDAVHDACLSQLTLIGERLGRRLSPIGTARARGIRPALRDRCFAPDYLRVGDACYTSDPLSGHGVFEAASGALAAAPAINTLLNHPAEVATAIDYLDERVRTVYSARMSAAREHYRAESAWAEAPFWRCMHAMSVPQAADELAPEAPMRLVDKGVVEHGRIVSRPVLVSPAYPRGVRFVGAVDLGELIETTRRQPGLSVDDLSRALRLPADEVSRACAFIHRIRQADPADTREANSRHS
ncbi:hypothetical protein G3580_00195 [Nitrogeniibacter mangrovi]|uniref:FAD-binding domain-containing protein n=1 Tax=Nitrogeniibacter mangrovi TaxID=2016596 RepID=A0A6C1B1F8_9RHOO|nr:FAD-dependent monooxygenase [Nitrogeniibacter mangrovi]QID16180.1 hypothetical protein G3580_00195 [Nitrogeniibacter mangrovi]